MLPDVKGRLEEILSFQEVDLETIHLEKTSEHKFRTSGSYGTRYGSNESLETQYEEFDEEGAKCVTYYVQ